MVELKKMIISSIVAYVLMVMFLAWILRVEPYDRLYFAAGIGFIVGSYALVRLGVFRLYDSIMDWLRPEEGQAT